MNELINMARQFLTERDWWRFHNPKNNTTNVLIESCELLELFNFSEQATQNNVDEISGEMADVFFASLICSQINSFDISDEFRKMIRHDSSNNNLSYNDIRKFVLENRETFGLEKLKTPQQIAISLVTQARKLADYFIWCSEEQSIAIAKNKQEQIAARLVNIFAHLYLFSFMIGVDLAQAYKTKMLSTAKKYPVS